MAVADVAVQMGPRNRRRTITGAVIVVVIAIVFWGGRALVVSTNHDGGSATSLHLSLIPDNLSYGMTKEQMVHRLGRPEKIAGSCWQYRENVKNFVGQTINAVRLCFVGNTYQQWLEERDGKWRDPLDTVKVFPPPKSIR